MTTITLQEAQAGLPELVHQLAPGGSVTITEDDQPVAQLVGIAPLATRRSPRPRPPVTGIPKAGQYEGRLVVPADFKDPMDEMREYTE